MLKWLADLLVNNIDMERLANLVEAKLAQRLDARLNSKLRKYMIVPLKHKRPSPSESPEKMPNE